MPPKSGVEDGFGESVGGVLCKVYEPKISCKKVIIYSHGNAENISQIDESIKMMSEKLKVKIITWEYPGYKEGKMENVNLKKTYEMSKECVEEVMKRWKIGVKDLVFFGRSLGSVFATCQALNFPNAYGLILSSGIANVSYIRPIPGCKVVDSVLEMGAKCMHLNLENLSCMGKIDKKMNMLFLHGDQDQVVNVKSAEINYKKRRSVSENVDLCIIGGGGHNNLNFYEVYFNKIEGFIKKDQKRWCFSITGN